MNERQKRLAYRAQRRGFKEADILFQRFAEARLAGFSPAELDAFELLLEIPDQDVFDWVLGRRTPPPAADGALLQQFLAFARAGVSQDRI